MTDGTMTGPAAEGGTTEAGATVPSAPRWRDDGWAARTRIGIIAPHADAGPEAEIGAMAPPGVSLHGARLYFGAMRPGGQMDEKIPHDPVLAFVEPPAIDDTVELLAAAPLDVIVLGFTSSAYRLGLSGERRLIERLERKSRRIPIVSTGTAARHALAELGAERIALIHPPWFDDTLDAMGAEYFGEQGFTVVHHSAARLPSSQAHITPQGVFDYAVRVASGADAVFIAGNGFRAVGAVQALEEALGVPVLSANQVLLWRALRMKDVLTEVRGYGRLFSVAPRLTCGESTCIE